MNIIETYVDKCLSFAKEHEEYLLYVPSYDGEVETEMLYQPDFSLFSKKLERVFLTQEGRTDSFRKIGTEKDMFWKPVENTVTDKSIQEFEQELKVILPKSYKHYLKYKHHYEIFWDIEIILYAKPVNRWKNILLEVILDTKEEMLDKGYLAIGRFSDCGEIALKLGNNETDEHEVVVFDNETAEIDEVLASNFTEFLEKLLQADRPQFRELKEWQKKMSIFQ